MSYIKREDQERLKQNRTRKHTFWRLIAGLGELIRHKRKCLFVLAYLVVCLVAWYYRDIFLIPFESKFFTFFLLKKTVEYATPILAVMGLCGLIIMLGTPKGVKGIHDELLRSGFTNHAGEAPLLLAKYKFWKNPHITVWEFANNALSKKDWEDNKEKLESALDSSIKKMDYGKTTRRIILHTIPTLSALPKILYWEDEYLSSKSFELVLGESLTERVTVNLALVPHILLGGSSGSGKSLLLKLLLMQAVKKGAVVYIADFKGGVDFSTIWHKKCCMCFDEEELLGLLTDIVNELERRKAVFRETGHANLDEYNKAAGTDLKLIIFAFDEVAEAFDKTGLSKEQKEVVSRIEGLLAVIARQGRAFGIHLILATQRPSADILVGQIRNNIDYRVCGRADNVLSQIILDNTDAAEKIPKDAQGYFLTNTGITFQSYLFDESSAFQSNE